MNKPTPMLQMMAALTKLSWQRQLAQDGISCALVFHNDCINCQPLFSEYYTGPLPDFLKGGGGGV